MKKRRILLQTLVTEDIALHSWPYSANIAQWGTLCRSQVLLNQRVDTSLDEAYRKDAPCG
jgi:hypothetical protein